MPGPDCFRCGKAPYLCACATTEASPSIAARMFAPKAPSASDILPTPTPTGSAEEKLRARVYALELLSGALADAAYRANAVARIMDGDDHADARRLAIILCGHETNVLAQIREVEAAVASLGSGVAE